MGGGIKNRLELIRKASLDVKAVVDEILKKDDRIDIATCNPDAYADDLFGLMKQMAEVANPVLKRLGLDKEAIREDIEEYVKILSDNEHVMYFASVNIDAKYSRNKYALKNISRWLGRLNKSIDRVLGYLETDTEAAELKQLFGKIDETELPQKKKEELKEEFVNVLNRLNR